MQKNSPSFVLFLYFCTRQRAEKRSALSELEDAEVGTAVPAIQAKSRSRRFTIYSGYSSRHTCIHVHLPENQCDKITSCNRRRHIIFFSTTNGSHSADNCVTNAARIVRPWWDRPAGESLVSVLCAFTGTRNGEVALKRENAFMAGNVGATAWKFDDTHAREQLLHWTPPTLSLLIKDIWLRKLYWLHLMILNTDW